MAIGDTVQAGLMRIDPSAIERAGQANAKANQAFGLALGEVAKGYFVGQEKKARANEIKEELMRSGLPEEAAANISKNPFLQKEHARKKEAENRMEIAKMQSATSRANAGAPLAQKAAEMEEEQRRYDAGQDKIKQDKQNQMGMAEALLAETADPAVLEDFNQAQPGLFALGGDQGARNRFLEFQRDEAPTVLGGELDSSNFARYARKQNLDPVLAGSRFMKLRDREAEENKGTGKTMTINDPATGQNVIAQVNPDGSPGRVVGIAPTQPPRIRDPRDEREANINKTEDNQAMATEADWKGRALTGRNTIQTVKTMLSTLDKVDDTGGFEPFKNTLRKYAMSAGVDFTDAEKEELANAEKFTQLSGEFVFKAISQTKGSISEKEMDLFQAMSPSMVNSKLGNRLMLEYAQKRADRDIRLNKYIQGLKKQKMLPQERVEMAMDWLNDPANDITQDLYKHFGTTTTSSNPPPQTQPNRSGVRGSNPPPNSNAQTPGGFQIK